VKRDLKIAEENLKSLKAKKNALDQSKTDINIIQREVHGIVSQLETIMRIWSFVSDPFILRPPDAYD
jgi:hypothetical protein